MLLACGCRSLAGMVACGPWGGYAGRVDEWSRFSDGFDPRAEFGVTFVPSYFASARGLRGLRSPAVVASFSGAAVDAEADASAFRCAFSMISSCFDLSFARIGTRSLGTGVTNLKFFENFIKSLSLIALSCETRWRR